MSESKYRLTQTTNEDYRNSFEYKLWVQHYGQEEAERLLKGKIKNCRMAMQKAQGAKRIPKEEHYVKEIVAYLKTVCHFVWRNHTTGLVGDGVVHGNPTKGIPDLMGLLSPKVTKSGQAMFIALEVKRPPFRPPSARYNDFGVPIGAYAHHVSQRAWIEALKTEGTITGFVDGVEKVKALIEPYIYLSTTGESAEFSIACQEPISGVS